MAARPKNAPDPERNRAGNGDEIVAWLNLGRTHEKGRAEHVPNGGVKGYKQPKSQPRVFVFTENDGHDAEAKAHRAHDSAEEKSQNDPGTRWSPDFINFEGIKRGAGPEHDGSERELTEIKAIDPTVGRLAF